MTALHRLVSKVIYSCDRIKIILLPGENLSNYRWFMKNVILFHLFILLLVEPTLSNPQNFNGEKNYCKILTLPNLDLKDLLLEGT